MVLNFMLMMGNTVIARFSGLDIGEDLAWDSSLSQYSMDGLDDAFIDRFINAASTSSSILVTITPDMNQGSKRPKPIKGES